METCKMNDSTSCSYRLLATRDALEVIQGKWRVPIIISLSFGSKRFGAIKRDIADISPKMLSKELKELETNQLISRNQFDTMPVVVEYSLTPFRQSTRGLLEELLKWGISFRQELMKKSGSEAQ